ARKHPQRNEELSIVAQSAIPGPVLVAAPHREHLIEPFVGRLTTPTKSLSWLTSVQLVRQIFGFSGFRRLTAAEHEALRRLREEMAQYPQHFMPVHLDQ